MDFAPFQPPLNFNAFAQDASAATIQKVMTMYTHPSTTAGEKQAAANILTSMGVPLPKPKAEPAKAPTYKVTPEWWTKQQEAPKPKSYTYTATYLPHKTMWMIRRSDGRVAYISSVYAGTEAIALNLASKPGINWS